LTTRSSSVGLRKTMGFSKEEMLTMKRYEDHEFSHVQVLELWLMVGFLIFTTIARLVFVKKLPKIELQILLIFIINTTDFSFLKF